MKAGKRSRPSPPVLKPPRFVEVMAAREVADLPDAGDWIREIKWDGYRTLARKDGEEVELRSRNDKTLTAPFKRIAELVRELPATGCLLDGEVVALDAHGRPSFQSLQNRRARDIDLHYYAFDLLWLDGEDWRDRPLCERNARLAELLEGSGIRLSRNLSGSAAKVVDAVRRLGLQGVIAKQADSKYISGERHGLWLKLKLSPEQEFVIGGFKRGTPLESLIVGYYDGRKLICAGKVRQGLNPQNRRQLRDALVRIATDRCPFSNVPNSKEGHWGEGITAEDMREIQWVEPRVVAQVSFTEWTEGGNLRHASFKGVRTDKSPRSVRRET